ncbi:MAG: hypothetical protein NVSMB62_15600 [Acidobacteriaceae bacterium]
MRRFFFWATVASGAVAAYLMFKRGESFGQIAQKTVTNPVGSLVNELRTA